MEGRALGHTAFNRDVSAHQARELTRYGEAKAGSPKAPGDRGVSLGEGAEKARQGRLVHADSGIRDRHPHIPAASAAGLGAETDADAPALGELDGVGQQVADALAHAHWIVA